MDEPNARIFPELRKGLILITIGIAKLLKYVCYLLCATFLYKLYANFEKSKAEGHFEGFVITFLLAIALWRLEWLFSKDINKIS